MHEYRVVERWVDQGLCALECNFGRFHVARPLHVMPPAAFTLVGDQPRLGFGLLVCTATGAIFRMIFESINHSQLLTAPGARSAPTADQPCLCARAAESGDGD
jgi:hypothetical protein